MLAVQLPPKSRCALREVPDLAWDDQTMFISNLEYEMRLLLYSHTEDAKHGFNKPKPNITPGKRADIARKVENSDREGIARQLGIKLP